MDVLTELDCNRNSIAPRVLSVFGRIIDNRGQKQADGDTAVSNWLVGVTATLKTVRANLPELIGADDGTTNPFRGRFGLVQGD